jgi:hypothetical protein
MLKVPCKVYWSAFGVGCPEEESLDKTVVSEVYRVIVEKPEYPDQFPYIDCWQDAVLSQPKWLRSCMEEACKIMVSRLPATCKCREKIKKPILAKEPKEIPPPYVPLYPPLPLAPSFAPLPLTLGSEA